VAVLIPSIDLMDGKIVQLVQGRKKALEFDDFDAWIRRFSKYPLVQLIDLDAAMGKGSNTALVQTIASQLRCQVGGGIRSIETAMTMLDAGARRVIVGSSLFKNGELDCAFAQQLADGVGVDRLVFALDAIGGRVAIHGWTRVTNMAPLKMMESLEAWCSAFLYTHVDTEGLLTGFPQDVIRPLRAATKRQLIAAGGIRSEAEIEALHELGVDAVVGMAVYQGLIPA
jgi:phosphoribosylformimino-5-aminoimidazole carboxamide ribotide isomerase